MELINKLLAIYNTQPRIFFQELRHTIETYAKEDPGYKSLPLEILFGIVKDDKGFIRLLDPKTLQSPYSPQNQLDFLFQHKIDDFVLLTKQGTNLSVFWNHLAEDCELQFNSVGESTTIFYKDRTKSKTLPKANIEQIRKDIEQALNKSKGVA